MYLGIQTVRNLWAVLGFKLSFDNEIHEYLTL